MKFELTSSRGIFCQIFEGYIDKLRDAGFKVEHKEEFGVTYIEVITIDDLLRIMEIVGHPVIIEECHTIFNIPILEIYDDWRE